MQVGEMVVSSLSRTSLEDGLFGLDPALCGMTVDDTAPPTLSISLARTVDPPCRTQAKVDENGPNHDLDPGRDPERDPDRCRRSVPAHTYRRGRGDYVKHERNHQQLTVLI
jgi:hypothetical protein